MHPAADRATLAPAATASPLSACGAQYWRGGQGGLGKWASGQWATTVAAAAAAAAGGMARAALRRMVECHIGLRHRSVQHSRRAEQHASSMGWLPPLAGELSHLDACRMLLPRCAGLMTYAAGACTDFWAKAVLQLYVVAAAHQASLCNPLCR